MALETLPTELLHRICEMCATEQVQQLRLVSTRISMVADEHLLPVLELYYAFESTKLALAIADRPRIARSIRFVCFHADRLNGQVGHSVDDLQRRCEKLSFDDWKAQRNPDGLFCNAWHGWSLTYPGAPLRIIAQLTSAKKYGETVKKGRRAAGLALRENTLPLEVAYAYYLRRWHEQELLDRGDMLEKAFGALFRACSNLDNMLVTNGESLAPTTTGKLSSFRKALAFPLSDPDSPRSGIHALSAVMRAASNAQKPLRSLGAGRISHHFFLQKEEIMDRLRQVFGDVERFVFQLETPFEWRLRNGDEEDMFTFLKDPKNQQIPTFLSAARHLQELTIILPGRGEQGRLPIHNIVGANHWPRLRKLRLDWFAATQDELVDLLLRHKTTLQDLHLADVTLTEGCLRPTIRQIVGQFPALRQIRLRGIFQDYRQAPLCHGCHWVLAGGGNSYIGRWPSVEVTLQLQRYVKTGHGDVPPQSYVYDRKDEELESDLEPYLKYWIE